MTEAERLDLIEVCDMLGLHRATLDVLLLANAAPPPAVATSGPAVVTDLRGKSVCFTGELLSSLQGERVTREAAEKLATDAGLEAPRRSPSKPGKRGSTASGSWRRRPSGRRSACVWSDGTAPVRPDANPGGAGVVT